MAVEFAKRGARLVLVGRNRDRLESTVQKCRDVGTKDDGVNKLVFDAVCHI